MSGWHARSAHVVIENRLSATCCQTLDPAIKLFHFHCKDQGYELLARLFLRTAIEEMRHVEHCAERILFLGGEVEMTGAGSVQKIHDVKAMLDLACQMEQGSMRDYNLWANECSANADSGSRKVFEALVDDECHFSQYDLEMQKINKFSEQYLALQSIEGSREVPAEAEGQ